MSCTLIDEPVRRPQQGQLTDDSVEIVRFALDALASGYAAVLVTLVEVRGGAARAPGALMAVREDGRYCGFVSGGCVEAAAAHEALAVMQTGQDCEIRYGTGSPWFDIVLPCGGGITLSLHKLRSGQALAAVLARLERRQPAGLYYDPAAQALSAVAKQTQTGPRRGGFAVGFRPGVRVIVYGRSLEAASTADLAAAAGYACQHVERFSPASPPEIDADTAVVLLCHDLNRELPFLQLARPAQPFYLGALGSLRTHDLRLQRLRELGWGPHELDGIKAPIGLFPKARDARTLALSVLADIAFVRQRQLAE